MLPRRYSQALLAGESVAGFVVALNRIFTKLVISSERISSITFFAISLFFVLLCVGCFLFIRRSEFVKYHTAKCRQNSGDTLENKQEVGVRGEIPLEEVTEGDDVKEPNDHNTTEGQPDEQLLIPTLEQPKLKTRIISKP